MIHERHARCASEPLMHRRDVPIHTPCGADWSKMTIAEARTRLCAQCDKTVHDLSKHTEHEIRSLVSAGPACVRYLYDRYGNVLVGGAPAGARVISAKELLSKAQKTRWLAAAALAAVPIVFEACGGGGGGFGGPWPEDAGDAARPDTSSPISPDAGADGGDSAVDSALDGADGSTD